MDFDSTQIAIRERGFAEILDLALRVGRAHAAPLLAALVVGVTPWLLLNGLLLGGLLNDTLWENPPLYVFWILMLTALEAPLATAPITLYLGQVTFSGKGDARRIAGDFWRSLPQMIWSQVIVRALTAILVVPLILPYVTWPYLSELILLERNPLFAGKKKQGVARLTTSKRSRNLHRNAGGDLFGRWVASTLLAMLLIFLVIGGAHTIAEQIFGLSITPTQHLLYTFPIVLWLVVSYFAVVRFLAYLDLRIRKEGWEVELTMRAEAARMVGAAY